MGLHLSQQSFCVHARRRSRTVLRLSHYVTGNVNDPRVKGIEERAQR
jgi:hypothetical protein